MNKYQDILYRHHSTRSHPTLPNINLSSSTVANTPRDYDSPNVRFLSPTNNFLMNSNRVDDTCHITIESILKTKSNSISYLPKSKNISEFSIKQNEIITSFLTSRENEHKTGSFFPDIYSRNILPTEREFSKLIDNLNEVVVSKNMKLHTILQENEPVDVMLSEGKAKFFKIFMKHHKVPLSIKIKRTKGKLYAYTSTTAQEPGPTNYEKYYISDYIEIRDSATVFKYDVLYLGIKSFEESKFRIVTSFGRQINSLEELKRLKRQSIQASIQESLEINEEEQPIKSSIKNEPKITKNFIAENKNLSTETSDKASSLTIRAADWKARHDQILSKKKQLIEMKRSKALDSINKHTIKKQQEFLKAKEEITKSEKVKLYSFWLKIMSLISCSEIIHNIINKTKISRLRRISMNIKAKHIQSTYKRYTNNIKHTESAILRARNLLLIYRGNTKNIENRFGYGKAIVLTIKQASHFQIVYRKFSQYYKSVILIQRNTKKFLGVKDKRIKELLKIWISIGESMIYRKGNKKDDRKRNSVKFVTLPAHARDDAINGYYRKCVLRYREMIRNYYLTLKNVSDNKKIHNAVNQICSTSPPLFEYLPSNKEMEQLIESTIKSRA
ncbi:hypothetical protein SteCoe_32109 [Stentor coeruleus]|uniref:Uncharacterized protein n=1 Tax=Stentor coeruleus TaxID=5963 RepID=A0A1R2AZS4_9CILI|nr:hypothetical protein SteCoe_32109 [Stentor coeruleus]